MAEIVDLFFDGIMPVACDRDALPAVWAAREGIASRKGDRKSVV
mgnify:CR=1 FL=1